MHGGVYSSDGALIPGTVRDDDTFRHNPPAQLAKDFRAERVVPKGIFLGHWFWHFGHFLLETVPMIDAGILASDDGETPFLFFALGFHLLSRKQVLDVEKVFLDGVGLKRERIQFITVNTCVIDLVVPRKPYSLNEFCSSRTSITFQQVAKHADEGKLPKTQSKGVYLSRRQLEIDPSRFCVNEYRLERLYRRLGYDIVSPETLSFVDQVSLVSNSKNIVGLDGSALYLMGFSAESSVTCFALRNIISLKQFAEVCDVRYRQILVKPDEIQKEIYRIDLGDLVEAELATEAAMYWHETFDPEVEAAETLIWQATVNLASGNAGKAADTLSKLREDFVDRRCILIKAAALDGKTMPDALLLQMSSLAHSDHRDPTIARLYFFELLKRGNLSTAASFLRFIGKSIDSNWLDLAVELEVAGGEDILTKAELMECITVLPLCLRSYHMLSKHLIKTNQPNLAEYVTNLGKERFGIFWRDG